MTKDQIQSKEETQPAHNQMDFVAPFPSKRIHICLQGKELTIHYIVLAFVFSLCTIFLEERDIFPPCIILLYISPCSLLVFSPPPNASITKGCPNLITSDVSHSIRRRPSFAFGDHDTWFLWFFRMCWILFSEFICNSLDIPDDSIAPAWTQSMAMFTFGSSP